MENLKETIKQLKEKNKAIKAINKNLKTKNYELQTEIEILELLLDMNITQKKFKKSINKC